MKTATTNKWLNAPDINHRAFITDIGQHGQITEKELSEEDVKTLLPILEPTNNPDRHRCVSIYRDTVIINDIEYHLCLSCGDMVTEDEKFYLTKDQLSNLKIFKSKLGFE